MEEVIKLGETLLDDYHRLDDALANQRFLEHDEEISVKQDLEILISKVKAFNIDADHFIDSLQEDTKARVLLREKRRHEYANDYEIGSPLLHEFCSYGMTIELIINTSYLLDLVSRMEELYKSSKPELKNKLLRFLFSNLQIDNKELYFDLNDPFKTIGGGTKKHTKASDVFNLAGPAGFAPKVRIPN